MVEGDAWYVGFINYLKNIHEHRIGVGSTTPAGYYDCTLCNYRFSEEEVSLLTAEGVRFVKIQ